MDVLCDNPESRRIQEDRRRIRTGSSERECESAITFVWARKNSTALTSQTIQHRRRISNQEPRILLAARNVRSSFVRVDAEIVGEIVWDPIVWPFDFRPCPRQLSWGWATWPIEHRWWHLGHFFNTLRVPVVISTIVEPPSIFVS